MTLPDGNPTAKRLLIVEDEVLVAMDIEDILVQAGYSIAASASCIEQAMECATNHVIDAAILDMKLDQDQATDVAAELTRRGIPFIFVTGYGAESLPPEYAQTPLVSKPFSPQALVEKLAEVLANSQAEKS